MRHFFIGIAIVVLFTYHAEKTPAQKQEGTHATNFGRADASSTSGPRIVFIPDARFFVKTPSTERSRSSLLNYILNTTETQSDANFNISGDGIAGGTLSAAIVNANSQYNLGGQRVFSGPGTNNLFVGVGTGILVSSGFANTFVGVSAGATTSTGFNNSFFGHGTGLFNTAGSRNSYFGAGAGRNSANFASNNSFFGQGAGESNFEGEANSFFGVNSGPDNADGTFNVFVGVQAGSNNSSGSSNTAVGAFSAFGSPSYSYATAIGARSVAKGSNSITLGRPGGEDAVRMPGAVILERLSTGGTVPLCRNVFWLVSTCSSSARYKSNIVPFASGLDLINKLRPVSFNWKDGGMPDLGLVAEEVSKVESLLTTKNEKGEIEGVKYDRLTVVLINSIKEQQSQIETQNRTIDRQQAEINQLKQIVCALRPRETICSPK